MAAEKNRKNRISYNRTKATRMNRVAFAYSRWQQSAEIAVRYALAQRGKPYAWGATGPRAYDCSGLVQRAWRVAGVTMPRVTYDQYRRIPRKVSRRNLAPGDLVFFHGRGHVGMYIGRSRYVHSPKTGDHVRVVVLRARRDFAGAVRPAWPLWLTDAVRLRRR
nr:C40 family peptidase [Actinomadura atramentaria]